jgi:hypothetical protein
MNRRVLKKFVPALIAGIAAVGALAMVQSAHAEPIRSPEVNSTVTPSAPTPTPAAPDEAATPASPSAPPTTRPRKTPIYLQSTEGPQVPCGECA